MNTMYTCIIIDDNKWTLLDVEHVFPFAEYNIEIVGKYNNAMEAYAAILKDEPSIIITDICLGVKSGLDLVEDCIRDGRKCEYILISGYSEFEYARRAIDDDVCNYLTKPLEAEKCRAALEKACRRLRQKMPQSEPQNDTDKIRAYMMEHIKDGLSLEKIALNFHMNKTYFSEYFKNLFHMTFVQYRNELCIEYAKEMLVNSDKKILHISMECGYENADYFTTFFRRMTGMTPVEYRKLYKKES